MSGKINITFRIGYSVENEVEESFKGFIVINKTAVDAALTAELAYTLSGDVIASVIAILL